MLGDCVETYIELPEEELTRFRGIIDANATGRVQPVNKTRVQIAEEKGMEKGIEEGLLRGLRAAVCELLEARFAPVPTELLARVNATTDPDALRQCLRTAATATDLTAIRL